MSQLLRRLILRPNTQPRRMGGGGHTDGPLNPKPGERWVKHDRPQDDWIRYGLFVTIPTAFYFFHKHARDSAIGQKIVAWRMERYLARRQRQWEAKKQTLYSEHRKVLRNIEGKKFQRHADVPAYEDVFSGPIGASGKVREPTFRP